MRTNPFWDALRFLLDPKPGVVLLWVLLAASVAVAVVVFRRDPAQRTLPHLWMFVSRVVIGAMWWQQSLWKPPPTYTTAADGSGGLRMWMEEMVKYASFSAQSRFVKDVVLEHFRFFAPQVWFAEVVIAISLILGVFTRLGATLGFLMAVNLWFGLYRASFEWPWTYFFLIVVNGTFAVYRAGRSLGVDALIAARPPSAVRHRFRQRLVHAAT
jgi:uncharacterized membrane protein YphA (DoxX/SURF4 family)